MAIDLRSEVFEPVLARMKQRVQSLRGIKRFKRTGIEAWFKVEVVAALGKKVKALRNKGPDLDFADPDTRVELKAATDFNKSWHILQPIRKYGVPCLFLGDGTGRSGFSAASSDDFEVVGFEIVSDGTPDGEWIIGLVKPKR